MGYVVVVYLVTLRLPFACASCFLSMCSVAPPTANNSLTTIECAENRDTGKGAGILGLQHQGEGVLGTDALQRRGTVHHR